MALKIRLRQQGRRNRLFFRLVLADVRSPRDGKYVETLGWYNPHESRDDLHLSVNGERVRHWLNHGAQLTEEAEALVKQALPGLVQEFHEKAIVKRSKVRVKNKERRAKKRQAAA